MARFKLQLVTRLLSYAAVAAVIMAFEALALPAWPGFGSINPILHGSSHDPALEARHKRRMQAKRDLSERAPQQPKRVRRPLTDMQTAAKAALLSGGVPQGRYIPASGNTALEGVKTKSPLRFESDPPQVFEDDFVPGQHEEPRENGQNDSQSDSGDGKFSYAHADCDSLATSLNHILGLGVHSYEVHDKCLVAGGDSGVITTLRYDEPTATYSVHGADAKIVHDNESISFLCAGDDSANKRLRLDKDARDAQIDCGETGVAGSIRYFDVKVRALQPGNPRHRDRIFDVSARTEDGKSALDLIGEVYFFSGLRGLRVSIGDQMVDIREGNVLSFSGSKGIVYITNFALAKDTFELSMLSRA